MMELDRSVQDAIGRHLEEVASQLSAATPEEADVILQEIEAHIHEALGDRFPHGATTDDLETVLSEMDPPSSYAGAIEGTPLIAGQPRFCRTAILAAVVACVAPILMVVRLVVESLKSSSSIRFGIGAMSILLAVVYYLLLTPPLGLVAVSQIRASRGGLIGMPLAFATAFVCPVFVISCGLFAVVSFCVADSHISPRSVAIVRISAVVLILALAFFILRAGWRWANRPLKDGEFA